MRHRIFASLFFLTLALLLCATPARAQNPDAAIQVFNTLVGAGYDVIEVGNYPDAQGQPDPDAVFVEMVTVTADFNERYLINQVLQGFDALGKYFSHAQSYIVVLRYERWLFIFVTNPADWDDVVQKRVAILDFWKRMQNEVRIYDTVEKKYLTAKDFTAQNQTNKNQTDKDFSGNAKSPLPPVNTSPDAQAENILLEPSTTYLPADGTSEAFVLATLTDQDFAGLPGRGVNFSFEVRGQEERELPPAQTDAFGTARSKIASSRPLDLVLLRASTATLNASVKILVGDVVGKNIKQQEAAVIEGLKSQGYADADAGYVEYVSPAGRPIRQALAAVRVTSKSFDREVYSQLFRMLGTMHTVMPDASFLRPLLLFAADDGHDYTLIFTLRADIWQAYLRGEISENQLWASMSYDGAVNENGVRTDAKDFLSKNFSGTKQTRVSSVARTVESTLTTETWGEQLTIGSFLVPIGGFADNFSVTELSDNASGFALYATPDFGTPVWTFTRGQEAALSALRLEAGQYIVSVNAPGAPAKVNLQFVEHLSR